MNILGLIGKTMIKRGEAVEEIITCSRPQTGYIIGFIAICSTLILKLIWALSSGLGIKHGLLIQLPLTVIKAAILLFVYSTIVFYLSKLFRGAGQINQPNQLILIKYFIPLWGWTLIPSVFLSVTLIPFATASKLALFSHSISTAFIICGFLAIAEFIWEVLLSTEMIAQAMQLKKGQAYLIYFAAFIIYTIINSTLF